MTETNDNWIAGARRKVVPSPWAWAAYALLWADYTAGNSSSDISLRVLGWAGVVLYVVFLLGVSFLGVVFIGAGVDTIASMGLVMIGSGALLLLIPGAAVLRGVRRVKKTGSLRTSRGELAEMRAGIAAAEAKESHKSLRAKIVETVILISALACLGVWETAYRSRSNWMLPALLSVFVMYQVWVQFRGQKSAGSER